MKIKLSGVLAATLALTMSLPTGAMAFSSSQTTVVASQEVASQELKKIATEKAELLTTSYGTTSVQYALIDNGKLILSGQTGKNDMKGKQPLTKDTLYGIGSVSKMYAAAAVMKLVDEGKVDLDAPVVQYVPDFQMKDERYKRITPRMLLNHSSGLQGTIYSNSFLFKDNDTYAHDTLLQQLSTQSLKADPGAFSVYCNDGFTLAEILVERVSGMSFTEFLHKQFTEPLKLNHTKTPQDRWEDNKRAGLYVPIYQGQLPAESVNIIGAGGISSTAEDMVRFSQLFMGQGNGILSDQAVKAMEQEEYKKGMWPDGDNILNYGLGWDSVELYPFSDYGIKGLAKGGDTFLQHASLVVLPEQKMAAAVLSSGGTSTTNQLMATELLLAALKEKGTIKDIKPNKSFGTPVKAKMPQGVAKKAGFYGNSGSHFKIEIKKNGELFVSSNPEEKFVYTANGSFINEKGTSKLNFVTEKNGRTYLKENSFMAMPGFSGQVAMTHYVAEKLEDNVLSEETTAAWAEREGVKFYLVNEKYSSSQYLVPLLLTTQINRNDGLEGYWNGRKITGPNTAMHQLQIPVMGGRDTSEARFYTEGDNEYMEMSGFLYVSGTNVKPLDASRSFKVTLQANGHARWFTIPQAAAGKTMTVTLPSKSSFAVYDEKGVCINFTVVSGKNKVKLPENGTVVFAGAPNSEFAIKLN